MKVAVSSKGKNLDSEVDGVFGRCSYFIIADIEKNKIKKTEVVENKNATRMGGAGIAAAQDVAGKKAKAVITGNIGPRASDVFKQFDISVYNAKGSVKDALKGFIDKKLKKIEGFRLNERI